MEGQRQRAGLQQDDKAGLQRHQRYKEALLLRDEEAHQRLQLNEKALQRLQRYEEACQPDENVGFQR